MFSERALALCSKHIICLKRIVLDGENLLTAPSDALSDKITVF